MSKLISPNIAAVIGKDNLSEGTASHASIEVKVTGNPSQIQRAFRHLSKGGKKALSKASVKTDVKEEPESEPAETTESIPTAQVFANNLLDS